MATVIAIAAHAEDIITGAGGTLAKYAAEGRQVQTIIFAAGENPRKKIKKSIKADQLIGGSTVTHFSLRPGHLQEDFHKKHVRSRLLALLERENPEKIFTHGFEFDGEHRAVSRIVLDLVRESGMQCEVYAFATSPITLLKKNLPQLVVDTTKTFTTKVKAALVHNQHLPTNLLFWKLLAKDRLCGLVSRTKYAELFYRLN
ncbi:MAG TPA: PIG-L family deacetylase [Candidatus Nanoarchaeia archaeon]|nr:PIG-L family deacetylase [Candidatus Nanoarchaeia archaeon]